VQAPPRSCQRRDACSDGREEISRSRISSFDAVVGAICHHRQVTPIPKRRWMISFALLKTGRRAHSSSTISAPKAGPRPRLRARLRAGWRGGSAGGPEFPWGAPGCLAKEAWRRLARRTAVECRRWGHFFADPLPANTILVFGGEPPRGEKSFFPAMRMKTFPWLLPAVLLALLRRFAWRKAPLSPATPPAADCAALRPATSTECAPPPPARKPPRRRGRPTGQATEPLGDRLAKSKRRVMPAHRRRSGNARAADAQMPAAGCRLIPPPGSPGGNPECAAEISRVWQGLDMAKA